MKRTALFVLLSVCLAPSIRAVEILRWERIPLSVPLVVGQERVIFVDRNMRVGVPAALSDRLRVQSTGGALYLRASAAIETTRLQLQDVDGGPLILIDVSARPDSADQPPLEPIRIIDAQRSATNEDKQRRVASEMGDSAAESSRPRAITPVPAVLIRFAAQSLYGPLRTIEPINGIAQVPVGRNLPLDTVLAAVPVRAKALAAWRLEEYWVTAIKLTNTTKHQINLDPRTLLGDFIAATFQHPDLGPAGESTDTTVLYLVTQGHGLAKALPPEMSAIDGALNLPSSVINSGGGNEK
jgi:integrating conjugative element protein (TIGR03749 family)